MKKKDKNENHDIMSNNPNNWKGIFYVNPKDSRIIVPKINPKFGWTLNFGHIYSYVGIAAIILILFFLFATNIVAQVNPTQNWSFNEDSESDGWDSKKMEEFNRFIIDSTNITGLLIVHKGQIVFDYGDIEENSYIASCRKSVLSMLYGKYVENGDINLDETLNELGIQDVKEMLPIEKEATIKDLISARSGIYLTGSNGGDLRDYAPERGTKEPGSYWLYSNYDFNLAGYIFEKETGKNIYDDVEDQLAIPLGMQDWDRSLQRKYEDATISVFPAYHMWFSTRDMARIGLLMLNRGIWNKKQVISENWVNEMLKQRTTSEEMIENVPMLKNPISQYGYGYMWWLFENSADKRLKNAYSALGAMGQSISVFPEIDVVVAYKTKSAYRRSNSGRIRQVLLINAIKLYEPK
jgi:CubicO group peptidase (beta-lactamase class C family)